MRFHLLAPLATLVGTLFAIPSFAQSVNQTANATLPSLFISPASDLAFALNVPSDSKTDLYFSLLIPSGLSWGAIGLGSSKMAGSLMLVAYSSASGQNITLSPRIAYGHSEPVYNPDIRIEALEGTGLRNGSRLFFNGRCSNCRAWNGGSLDVTSKSQSFLYASGPDGDLKSDDPRAPLKMHEYYGNFQLNMVQATGPGAVPVIPIRNDTAPVGTTLGLSVSDKRDMVAMMHAIIMIFCFVGMFPFGILVLRLGNFVRWHAVNQGLAAIGIIVGFGLGISTSSYYNRSKSFNSPHQILGILIFIFVLGQFVLGFMHHRIHKKTEKPTKLAPIHVWAGRIIIPLGVINAFLGFNLAQSPQYNWILGILVGFVVIVITMALLTKRLLFKLWNKSKDTGEQGGYNMEIWKQNEAQGQAANGPRLAGAGASFAQAPAPGPQPAMRSYANYGRTVDNRDLGPQHSAREYV